MNNKFALSFGVSLVIVGFLNIFFETSNIVLFGLSVSTMLFSAINTVVPKINSNKLELLYIIPFVVLVSIFCYSKSLMEMEIFEEMVNGKLTSILTFLSFGLIFISEFRNHKKEISVQKEYEISALIQRAENSNIILMLVNSYMDNMIKKGIIIDDESESFLNKIKQLSDEQMKMAAIAHDLLSLNKESLTIEDFNEVYKKNSKIINYDKALKDYEKQFKQDKRGNIKD